MRVAVSEHEYWPCYELHPEGTEHFEWYAKQIVLDLDEALAERHAAALAEFEEVCGLIGELVYAYRRSREC